jgi:uncharacterized membrane protein HdeD (DUF308 family)
LNKLGSWRKRFKKGSIPILLLGSVLVVLAGFSPGTVPYDSTWNLVALIVGIGLIIVGVVLRTRTP